MSLVLSNKQKELRPNIAFFVASYLATTALCEMILIYTSDSALDMQLLIPFFIIAFLVFVAHAIAYILKQRTFTTKMDNVIETLPLSADQQRYLIYELQTRSRSLDTHEEASQIIQQIAGKIEANSYLSEKEIDVINKIVFSHYPIRPTIERHLKA